MPHMITPDPSGKFIVVKVTGDITRHSAYDHVTAANAVGRELGVRRYLMDVTEARNVDSIVRNFEFAEEDIQTSPDIDPDACLATLVAPDDHSHDFAITLTKNAGLDAELFRDREEAIAHLLACAAEGRGDPPEKG